MEPALVHRIYELPPPGERELYVSHLPAAGRAAARGRDPRLRGEQPVGSAPAAEAAAVKAARARGDLGLRGRRGGARLRRFAHEAMAHGVRGPLRAPRRLATPGRPRTRRSQLVDRLEQELSRFRQQRRLARQRARRGERDAREPLDDGVPGRRARAARADGRGLRRLDRHRARRPRARARGAHRPRAAPASGSTSAASARATPSTAMAELLDEWGIERALVHGGFSSVLALGAAAGPDGWPLTLSAPRAAATVLARLPARQLALSASGTQQGRPHRRPAHRRARSRDRAAWVALAGRAARAGRTRDARPRRWPRGCRPPS